jgi:hypothetical protein
LVGDVGDIGTHEVDFALEADVQSQSVLAFVAI